AGTGTFGYNGDGGPATSAMLNYPNGVAVDPGGRLVIADTGRIRRVAADGTISTVAGNGVYGFSGDGGPATAAAFASPQAVAVDAAGAILIVDAGNDRLRRVTPDGTVTTIAGNGLAGSSGDGGPATAASLCPYSVAVEPDGGVVIGDLVNNRVRRIAPDGTISTLAGTGAFGSSGDGGPATAASLASVEGVAVDRRGDVYLASGSGGHVRMVAPDGTISTVAGNGSFGYAGDGGPATAAEMLFPLDVAVGPRGETYIADSLDNRIREVASDGTMTTLAGNGLAGSSGDGGPATQASFVRADGVAVDRSGDVFIADAGTNRVREVTPDGRISTVAGDGFPGFSGDGGPAIHASLNSPVRVAVDGSGDLLIADSGNSRIRRVSPSGIISTVAGNGTRGFSGDGGPATAASLSSPDSVTTDALGNVYIADAGNQRIRKVTTDGRIGTVAGNGGIGYAGDGGPATSASFDFPESVAVGPGGELYIADSHNQRIRSVSVAGIITTVAGQGIEGYSGDGGPASGALLDTPISVCVDRSGHVVIADALNNRVRAFGASLGLPGAP
ncbi:MAG TPA: hypothetical protein VN180_02575, partial [Acidimicrobiia bacterium]|nr:hypothetical protein [Acidimicrobiia bacterium]